MVELTVLRKEIGEVRAVTSELRDARTELTNARVSLGEVARRVAGAEGAKATTARRVLARGSYGDEDAEVVPGENEYRAPRRAGPGRELRRRFEVKSAHWNGYGGALSANSLGFSVPLGPSPSRVRVEIESR